MKNFKISVVLSTYNRSDLINNAVQSILTNTYPYFEIVIVDQSENSLTEEKIKLLNDEAKAIRYFRISTKGLGRARNFGIKQSQGQIIAFTDDDCVVNKDWLKAIAEFYQEHPEVSMLFGSVLPPEGYQITDGFVPIYTARDVSFKGVFSKIKLKGIGANMCIKKDLFDAIGGFDERLGSGSDLPGNEDYDYAYRALRDGFIIYESSSLKVIHVTIRRWEDSSIEKFKEYEISRLAIYFKYMRCGDLKSFLVMILDIWLRIFQILKFSLWGPKLSKMPRIFFFFYIIVKYHFWWLRGIIKSFTFGVDKKNTVFHV